MGNEAVRIPRRCIDAALVCPSHFFIVLPSNVLSIEANAARNDEPSLRGYDFERILLDPRCLSRPCDHWSTFWQAKVTSFVELATWVQERWVAFFPSAWSRRQIIAQYMRLLQRWTAESKKLNGLWEQGTFQWHVFWRARHSNQDWLPNDCREAFFVYHAFGSILASEATCESLASQLKRYSSTGMAPGRAVQKALCLHISLHAEIFASVS